MYFTQKSEQLLKAYFFSDIHFGTESPRKEKAKRKLLKLFLNRVMTDSKDLFIIGDLFDLWFEYKTAIQKEHFEVLHLLKNAIDDGLNIHYVAGNHDFWVGDFLKNEFGIHVYMEPSFFTFDSKRFFLSHGDGIAKNDTGYRLLKKVFRFKPNITMYRWLHPDLGIPLAKWVSGTSRKHSGSIDLHDEDDYIEYAEEHIGKGADFVLMGHRHNPVKHLFPNDKCYVNTGDWLHHYSYAVYEHGSLELKDLKNEFTHIFHSMDTNV